MICGIGTGSAAWAAFAEESDAWLDGLLRTLDENRVLLEDLLATHLPGARYRIPDAGYLAWIDARDLGLGSDPAATIIEQAGVAVSSGPSFGIGGDGYLRFNLGTSPTIIEAAVGAISRIR